MKLKVFITGLLISFCFFTNIKAQKLDPDFSLPTPITSAEIRAIRVQDDGKILVGGSFKYYESLEISSLIRLNNDGTLDETFQYNSDDKIYDIEVQSTGAILINTYKKLIQLNSVGQVVAEIDSLYMISTFITQPDDKVVVIGYRKIDENTSTPALYRFNSDLTPDPTFNQTNSFDSYLTDIALQNDKIIVSGRFSEINGIEKNNMARFSSLGELDESFDIGTGTDDGIGSITIQDNGKILIGDCYLNNFNGDNSVPAFIRLNENGDRDASFQTPSNINGPVSEIFIHDSTIYYEAFHYYSADSSGDYVFRIDSLGNIDETFTPITLYNDDEFILEFTGNEKILSNGLSLNGNSFGLSKYSRNGELDNSFMPAIGNSGTYETGSYYNGIFVVTGEFLRIGDIKTCKLAMINQDGSINTNFVFEDSFMSNAVARKPSQIEIINEDTIYVALGNELYKLNSKGVVDDQFVRSGITDPSYFVGEFKFLNNDKIITASPNGIFKLNADGTSDGSFTEPTFNCASTAYGMDTLANKILYHSCFSTVNGLDYNNIVKLNLDGSVDETFNPGQPSDFDLNHLTVINQDEFLLFDTWGNEQVVKMSSNGAINEEFRTNFSNSVPSTFYPYSSIYFKENILISCHSSNNVNSFYSLELLDTTGTFSNEFSIPSEIADIEDDIKLIPAEEKSVILLSEFYLTGKSDPVYGLKLIYNDIPEITGITEEYIMPKDTSFVINLEDLIVTDTDNSYPEDFTLTINEGENYSVKNDTIILNTGFAGTVTIPVYVTDGIDDSPEYNINVEVINQVPEITGTTKEFTTSENTPITINLGDLVVVDLDNSYPDDFTLNINSGSNYSFENHTITPDNNFVGTLTVPLYVNDGNDDSPVYNIEIEVSQASGVNEIDNKRDITIFPNPAINEFNISFTNNYKGEVSIRLINVNGNLIKETHYQKTSDIFNKTIFISDIKTGIYIVEVEVSENSRIQERIIVN